MTWQQEAEQLIHAVDPLDRRPVYILSPDEVRDFYGLGPWAGGFTSRGLEWQLQTIIGERWRGPGFATVIDESIERGPDRLTGLLGVALHEFAHGILARASLSTPGDKRTPEIDAALDQLSQVLFSTEAESPPAEATIVGAKRLDPPWLFHDGPFIRICCHLAFRARYLSSVTLEDIVRTRDGLSCCRAYASELGDEPERLVGERLVMVALTEPPAAYRAFSEWDVARARQAMEGERERWVEHLVRHGATRENALRWWERSEAMDGE